MTKPSTYLPLPKQVKIGTSKIHGMGVFALEENRGKKIWIHCAANMRVSAFVYKYRRDILKLKDDEVIKDMKLIWSPNHVWSSFLNKN